MTRNTVSPTTCPSDDRHGHLRAAREHLPHAAEIVGGEVRPELPVNGLGAGEEIRGDDRALRVRHGDDLHSTLRVPASLSAIRGAPRKGAFAGSRTYAACRQEGIVLTRSTRPTACRTCA